MSAEQGEGYESTNLRRMDSANSLCTEIEKDRKKDLEGKGGMLGRMGRDPVTNN